MFPASPGVDFDVLGWDVDAEDNQDLSDIPLSGSIDICSSSPGDFSLTPEEYAEFWTSRTSNAGEVFRLPLVGLITLDE